MTDAFERYLRCDAEDEVVSDAPALAACYEGAVTAREQLSIELKVANADPESSEGPRLRPRAERPPKTALYVSPWGAGLHGRF